MRRARPNFLLCPICFKSAVISESTLSCDAGHSFDRAKKGYYNLDLNSGITAKGDKIQQVEYRDSFLSRQYFKPITDRLEEIVVKTCLDDDVNVLDAGVGSGHYLRKITGALEANGRNVTAIGLDVSKACSSYAAKRLPFSFTAVYDLRKPWPLMSNSLDVIINAFSPHNFRETRRSLKTNGVFLLVFPLPNHFITLRQRYGLLGIEEKKILRYRSACSDNFSSVIEHRFSYSREFDHVACRAAVMMGPNGIGKHILNLSNDPIVEHIEVGALECREPKSQS